MARQWILNSRKGFETSLEYQQNLPVPSAKDLGPHDVAVQLYAASLNYRELVIPEPDGVNGPMRPGVVPGCDGAGIVRAIGSAVTDFKPGDRVITASVPKDAQSKGDDEPYSIADVVHGLGQGTDGSLRSHGVFEQKSLVHAPASLDLLHAATISCTWSTAWNALHGVHGREVGPGSWVLVQGTGGASTASLQIAHAAGATVVATTSSEDKAARLKSLGAHEIVNYRTTPKWGEEARRLTPQGRGFDFVIDIGGDETLPQSLAAVRVNGIVVTIGGVGNSTAPPVPVRSALLHTCILRGLFAGSRNQLKQAVKLIDTKGIKPAVDDVVFELAETKDAYRRMKQGKHFAKILIRIDHEQA